MPNPSSTPTRSAVPQGGVLTVPEAAKRLRVCDRTIYDAIRDGRIEAFKIGSSYRIPEEAMWEALRVRLRPHGSLRKVA